MKFSEVIEIVKQQESFGLKYATLLISKPKSYRQKSEYMRTAFGMCRAHYHSEDKNSISFVIHVPIDGMKKWLKNASAIVKAEEKKEIQNV